MTTDQQLDEIAATCRHHLALSASDNCVNATFGQADMKWYITSAAIDEGRRLCAAYEPDEYAHEYGVRLLRSVLAAWTDELL